ncbi:MAG: DUF1553 domain-containing protein [Cyclobacteriaceae bacterium]|nr:DUF1553 domain-containing protein [Cyclobacteriaceae bacterium]
MKTQPLIKYLLFAGLFLFFAVLVYQINLEQKVDYNAEVKPLLNKYCISCHGGVKQSGGFSLLFQEEAFAPTQSGVAAIIPGHPEKSEMIKRLHSNDPEERMPYKENPLSKEEIDILTRWIKQGAEWGRHWAYEPVRQPEIPIKYLKSSAGKKNTPNSSLREVDLFILKKLEENQLQFSPLADKKTLLRRLSLDIIGMPPPDQIANDFLNDSDDSAYEKLADALLSTEAFGEKWATMWLDLARYADTKGFERDGHRNIWKYRDWLIRAFNEDKPYDQFLTEQLAGDLLPDPDENKWIATAFHRNTMTNDEGGTDNEEFRIEAVLDRVNNTWESIMGTTFECVQCHSHPYDPFTIEEYYQFYAFFNNTRDEDTFDDYPLLRHFRSEDSLTLERLIIWLTENCDDEKSSEVLKLLRTWQPSYNSLTATDFINSELADTKWLVFRNNGIARLPSVDLNGKKILITRFRNLQDGGTWFMRAGHPDGPVLRSVALGKSNRSWYIDTVSFTQSHGIQDLYFSYHNPGITNPDANALMFDWFFFTDFLPFEDNQEMADAFWELLRQKTHTTPVMMENPATMQRKTHVFIRGSWLEKGEEVYPDVPASLLPLPEEAPANRLGMALWISDKNHPLTSRTFVNRIWEQLMGKGLVETLEDFGSQGADPTHPELLDYLAWHFMHDLKWSVKGLIKSIVMSHTYRQQSVNTEEMMRKDPYNIYYARAPRVRLTAEQIRDQALEVSGLLSAKMYGPPVMPYQPEGIWLSPYNSDKWVMSEGEDRYRRAIYTYWKRTSPYPSALTFDGMAREVCVSRRIRTNTPLQALVTLNDSVYVEAAVALASHMMEKGAGDLQRAINAGYQLAMLQDASSEKLAVLQGLYHNTLNELKNINNPLFNKDKIHEPEQVAMQMVATAILNLDEFLTKN